ncbi:coatomer alpha subunit, putative [Plasmodium relictum]|uniref:Coatomer alpha subunit, putative n=1 Tax=Plasmodium relictum TaxID=85471 RepID=A0A1J1H842_PLARL|nr:coatomer alpha subunit, putative [Plasmodium relictum]CRH01067.1 coatomer alpha subunit, putative [Plasmodium relictum]
MLVKCETKSQRVKSISFHPKINLILAGLHNGVIQMWDYRIGILIEKFEEHEGPVRGIDFHNVQPLFVSGADDYLIKVWNIHLKKCVFNLVGHLDYIRKVQFHPDYPWILSASDDQTIRIWNWQSRVCIAILTGHNHYVMCAEFHPNLDLIISSSLDKTLRVWDIKLLREKHVISKNDNALSDKPYGLSKNIYNADFLNMTNNINTYSFISNQQNQQSNMFGASDAICKFILEGHEKGVNCCAFHHNLPIIASGSDDKLVKLWRYNDNKCWELDTLRGHFNNVSSLLFHRSNDDLLLSNSEDRTIRIWDINKRVCIHTFRRENDRFWVLAFKPNSNLISAGHDSGMVIFKFEKEKCPFDKYENLFFYCKEKSIVLYDIQKDVHSNICGIRKNVNSMISGYHKLIYNNFCTTHIMIIFIYKEEENFSFDLIICDKINTPTKESNTSPFNVFNPWSHTKNPIKNTNDFSIDNVKYIIKNKQCCSATFLSRNKYIFVERKNNSYVLNIHNLPDDNLYKKVEINFKVENIYSLNNNKIIIFGENKIYLYDINLKKILNEMNHTDTIISVEVIKDHIAFVFKYNVVITTIDLNHLCTVHEYVRVKSGVWDENNKNAFIYNTFSHLKYILINGEKGLIKYMDEPVYLFKIYNNNIYYINRQQIVKNDILNDTEYLFKLALINNNEELAHHYLDMGSYSPDNNKELQKKKLYFSYNLIGYIKKKGFANLAIQMVNNNHTLFNLSIQLGHLNNALKAAKKIDKKHIWNILSVHALLLGNFEIAEYSLQRNKAYDKLSLLYFFSGNIEKLKKMLSISIIRNDFISMFLNSLYLGDIEQRINIFIQQNQLNLALLCSHLYNIPINISEKQFDFDINECNYCPKKSYYLSPPIPIVKIEELTKNEKELDNLEKKGIIKSDKEERITWNNSYNWPSINLEQTYQVNKNEILKRQNLKSKQENDTNYKSQKIAQNIKTNVNHQLKRKEFPLEEEEQFNEIKAEEKSDITEEIDVWKNDVNDEDINIDLEVEENQEIFNKKVTKIEKGESIIQKSLKKNSKIIDFIRTENIQTALKLLSKKYGIVNMKPFKSIIKNIYISTYVYLTPMQNFLPLKIPVNMNEQTVNNTYITKHFLFNQIKKAHKLVTLGKFSMALDLFRNILYHIIFVNSEDIEKELSDYLDMCKNYILAMRLEEERNATASQDPRRSLELMAYFTCCSLQNSHLYLVLRRGMGLAWKAQNYVTAGSFAKRLINGNYENIKGSEEEIIKAKKILLMCEQRSTEQYNIDYDPNEYKNLRICCVSLKKIKANEDSINCPFCLSISKKEFMSKLCPNCSVAQLGLKALGFDFLNKNI